MLLFLLLPLALTSCGGEDKDEPSPNEGGNSNYTSESTEYLATEAVKTITLKTDGQEYMLFKDYYWKHKILLDGSTIKINSYEGAGNGWQRHNNHGGTWDTYAAGIRDWGELSSISQINEHTIHFSYSTSEGFNNGYGGPSSRSYYPDIAFKPNHGYELCFRVGSDYNINYIRFYPTNYTLDKNDKVSSITLQYQIF